MRRPECLVIRSTNHFNWLLSTQRSCSSTLCCIFPDIQTLLAATYSLWSYEGGKVDQLSSLQQPSKVSASLQMPHQLCQQCPVPFSPHSWTTPQDTQKLSHLGQQLLPFAQSGHSTHVQLRTMAWDLEMLDAHTQLQSAPVRAENDQKLRGDPETTKPENQCHKNLWISDKGPFWWS